MHNYPGLTAARCIKTGDCRTADKQESLYPRTPTRRPAS
jgi:hypothetical protein